jgi:hypothetical protein
VRSTEIDRSKHTLVQDVNQLLAAFPSVMVRVWRNQVQGVWCEALSVCGLVASMLASGTLDRGFDLGRNRRSMPSFGGEIKPSVPCRRFAAC